MSVNEVGLQNIISSHEYWRLRCLGAEYREDHYKKALDKIVNPIKYLQAEVDRTGGTLNGYFANELSNNARYLKRIAELALIEVK